MMKHKTTDEDFQFFKDRCDVWLEVLDLACWKVYYEHEAFKEKALADTSTHFTGSVATIRLNKNWNLEPTRENLGESALHEVLEILMGSLYSHAQSRVWDREEYERDHHRVIRTITKLLLRRPPR